LSLRSGLAVLAAALALALSACGGDDDGGTAPSTATSPATTATAPQATAPSATDPPPDATTPPGGAEHTARENDSGGEEPVRVDAAFTLRGGRLRPATVTTPAFLAVSLSVRNLDPVARVVVVRADRDYRLAVGPGRRAARQIPGQRAGAYPVLVGGRRRGTLVFGGEPGP
jgi:hypothetical protein